MHIPDAVTALERDLRGIFGDGLQSLVVYGLRAQSAPGDGHESHAAHGEHQAAGASIHTMAVVKTLSVDDLRACAGRVETWHEATLATPLVLAAQEFGRSLDAFPFEFGAILANHHLVSGTDPFDGLKVDATDLRRACEVQARGHWLHLREGYIETRGRSDALAVLIAESAPAFASLLASVARLDGAASADPATAARAVERRLELHSSIASEVAALAGVKEIPSADAERLFPPYLEAVERLVRYIDQWKG
jgi:hypothetical protein